MNGIFMRWLPLLPLLIATLLTLIFLPTAYVAWFGTGKQPAEAPKEAATV